MVMALTRKFLSALGIEADKIDEIITAHTESIEGVKADRDKYKADAEKLPNIQKELDEIKGKGDSTEAIAKVQKEFEDYKAQVTKEKANMSKREAYKELLQQTKVSNKRFDAILKLTDLDSIELDENGKIKDMDKVTESIKTEWADYIVTEEKGGIDVNDPPPAGGNTGEEDPSKMSYSEYKEWRKKNP